MSQQVVTSGPFRFCTRAQLDQVRIDFMNKAVDFNSGLTGASINGQSFQFATPDGQTYTREEFGDHLAAAFCQLGVTQYGAPTGTTAVARVVG